jgi:hypothetical protein
MYTTGGRGTASTATTVFEVTNLNDDNNPGSLRYALQATATYRTIVFRVSGTIHLGSKLNIRGNTTIAGQTAPGDGICVADYPVVISGDNVVLRYMRFRMGDKNQNKGMVDGSGGDDALGALGANSIIVDHCSVSWSDDEALTIYRWFLPLLELDIHSKLVQYIKLAETQVGLGSEYVRAPRLTLVGEERERILKIINDGIAARPVLPEVLEEVVSSK